MMRTPALRFALAGALLFFAANHWGAPRHATGPAVSAEAEDALLFDVALQSGLEQRDPLVAARLAELGRYLALAPDGADDAAFAQAARGLELVRTDPIIRRHLIDLMHLTAKTMPPAALPSERELRGFYEEHLATYTLPRRVRLRHVYLSRDRRGGQLAGDAGAIAARLRDAGADAGAGLGDAFARGASFGPLNEADLGRVFGPAFAAAALALPPHQWSSPIASAYGLHLVWIDTSFDAAPAPFADVRGQVLHAWLRERRADQLAASLSALRGG